MVLLGVDPHKDTHTVVAVDEVGRQLDQTTVAARGQGHTELLGWATRRWAANRLWAVEDCRHVTGRLERDLLAAGERVVRVPASVQVGVCQELAATIQTLTVRIDQLGKDLRRRIARLAPNLLSLPGCGVLTAAKLIAETAGVARFRSEACFAMHAGVAPIPVSSGRTDRHHLYRGGNRQLNAAVHRIAITQLRLVGPGQAYYRRRRAQGDGTGEAVRALKRRITRAVYQQLKLAEQRLRTTSATTA